MSTNAGSASRERLLAKNFGPPLAGLVVAAMVMLTTIATVQAASRYPVPPTAMQIEEVLQMAMVDEHPRMPTGFWTATLVEFKLRQLEQVKPFRWIVVTDLLFDFGPPPPAVIGFERRRRGQFRLVLEQENRRWKLKRFAPMGGIRQLPNI